MNILTYLTCTAVVLWSICPTWAADTLPIPAASPYRQSLPTWQTPQAPPPSPLAPAPFKDTPPERRGKYANPYDRSIPYQGDVHRGYKYGKKDPYNRN